MILLLNVKITSQGLTQYERGSWLPKYDRLDIFKYCLSSYAAMLPLISKCEFYIELAPEFANRRDELSEYITNLYPTDKLNLNWYRHSYGSQWREWCDTSKLPDADIIWFAGNDDHIFIDYDLSVLEAGIKLLSEDANPLGQIYYSHWPEQMRLAYQQGGALTEDKNYIVRDWRTFDAITMMKAERWRRYWFDNDWGDTQLWRTDPLWHLGYQLDGPVYTPTREIVRHYDGYSHTGRAVANITPPLVIPHGFFNGNINIEIGYNQRNNETTNFNPSSEWVYNFNPTGTDYRWLEDDIPLFWRDRIDSIFKNTTEYSTLIDARNAAYIASTRIPMTTYSTTFDHTNAVPVEWLSNNIRGKDGL